MMPKATSLPAGKVYRDLVFHRWWTHETSKTSGGGTAVVQGFHGLYEVSVTRNGATSKQTAELKAGGSTLKVVLSK
jgi:hypothetical protein